MPAFARYIGIDYSGAEMPTSKPEGPGRNAPRGVRCGSADYSERRSEKPEAQRIYMPHPSTNQLISGVRDFCRWHEKLFGEPSAQGVPVEDAGDEKEVRHMTGIASREPVEREKWQKEIELRQRELAIKEFEASVKDREVRIKVREAAIKRQDAQPDILE
jgi:hypothetical protein